MNNASNHTPNPADQTIKCKDCPDSFVFTAGEQSFYSQQGFQTPIRCKACREKRKAAKNGGTFAPPATATPVNNAYEEFVGGGGGRNNKRRERGGKRGGNEW